MSRNTRGHGEVNSAAETSSADPLSQEPPAHVIERIPNGADDEPLPPPEENGADEAPALAGFFDDIDALRRRNAEAFKGETAGPVEIDLVKPVKETYVRFHPDPAFYLEACLWNSTAGKTERRKLYYVDAPLWDLEDLQGGLKPYILAPWIGADKTLGLWPVSAGGNVGGGEWNEAAHEIVARGKLEWIRVQSDTNAKTYRWFLPHTPLAPPEWPPYKLGFWLQRAFGSRIITNENHEIIRKLRGR
jgi:hypothetical protein